MRRGTVALLLTLLAVFAMTGTGAVAELAAGADAVAAKKKCKKKAKGKAGAAKKCKKKKKGGGNLPPLPRLSISPPSHDYGSTLAPESQVFTVTNAPGTDTAGPFQVTMTGPQAPAFQVSENNCTLGTALQGGESCTFKVTFSPSGPFAYSATVEVDGGVAAGVSAALSGSGL